MINIISQNGHRRTDRATLCLAAARNQSTSQGSQHQTFCCSCCTSLSWLLLNRTTSTLYAKPNPPIAATRDRDQPKASSTCLHVNTRLATQTSLAPALRLQRPALASWSSRPAKLARHPTTRSQLSEHETTKHGVHESPNSPPITPARPVASRKRPRTRSACVRGVWWPGGYAQPFGGPGPGGARWLRQVDYQPNLLGFLMGYFWMQDELAVFALAGILGGGPFEALGGGYASAAAFPLLD